jgi:hypothetical protein
MMRETIRDQMAEAGITEEDLRELIQKLESIPGTKHVWGDESGLDCILDTASAVTVPN